MINSAATPSPLERVVVEQKVINADEEDTLVVMIRRCVLSKNYYALE